MKKFLLFSSLAAVVGVGYVTYKVMTLPSDPQATIDEINRLGKRLHEMLDELGIPRA